MKKLLLPPAPAKYIQADEARCRSVLMAADAENHKRGSDIDVGPGAKIILTAPNGSRWTVSVDNSGNLVVNAA